MQASWVHYPYISLWSVLDLVTDSLRYVGVLEQERKRLTPFLRAVDDLTELHLEDGFRKHKDRGCQQA